MQEYTPSLAWQQEYVYDRWGNRTIHQTNTWGTGINKKDFTVNTVNNRLGVPTGQSGVMSYDDAGNLTTDTYTSFGNRVYDAENKMTSAQDNSGGWSYYTYNADGQRTRRKISNQETWQVYGFEGELIAEYAANGSPTSPQKEYGYRNGQLLVTAEAGSSGGNNSLSLNGSTAYMEAPTSASLDIVGPITLEAWVKLDATVASYRIVISKNAGWGESGAGGGYRLAVSDQGKARLDIYQTYSAYTQLIGATALSAGVWHHLAGVFDSSQLRVYVDGVLDGSIAIGVTMTSTSRSLLIGRASTASQPYPFAGLIDEARVSNAALYTSNFNPQASLSASGSSKGLWKFDGQTANDSSDNGNNGTLNGGATYSTDVPVASGGGGNSLSLNGSTAYMEAPASASLDIVGPITLEAWVKLDATVAGYRIVISKNAGWGESGAGGGYRLAVTDQGKTRLDIYQSYIAYTSVIGVTALSAGVWHHLAGVFNGSQLRVYVDGLLDGSVSVGVTMTSTSRSLLIGRGSTASQPYPFAGLIDEARVSNAALYTSNFNPQTSLSASGSSKGLWKFDGETANDSSGNGNNGTLNGGATYSCDVPAGNGNCGGGGGGGSSPQIHWLVTDQLGTPRMILDQTGSLANVKRHDYLPFGEELVAQQGLRGEALGYSGGDGVRQQFTAKERDVETGLDYFGARYFASMQGRFTGADPYDINFERQNTPDPEEADAVFKDYIYRPQHWNRYAYALNNPVKFVDPDGLREYEPVELLGKKIKITISDNLKSADGKKLKGDDLKAAQDKIKQNIDNAIAKINSGADKLTSEEKTAINSMKGIEVRTDIKAPGMNGSTFQMTQRYAETDDPETLPAAFIHDSFHADQKRRGVPSSGREAEKQASAFTVPILEKLGMSNRIIEVYKRDAKTGHGDWGQRTRPPKKRTP